MHRSHLLFLLSLVLLAGCSKSTAPDPNAEIITVEVADDPVFTNYATTIKVVLQDSLPSNQLVALELQQPDGSYLDTLINRDTFFWVAPDQSGEYEHHIWIETEEGKVISETKSIEIEVIPWEGSNGNQLEGKLVFQDYAGDWLQIFSMNVDGSDLQQLTHFENYDSYEPAWSPKGTKVAFVSTNGGSSLGGLLWIMDSNGNNPYQVNDGNNIKGLYAKFPSWSPDGRYISFHLCYGCPAVINYDVYIFDTQVKKLIRLTDTPGSNTHPAWSPDGYRLIYSSNRDYIFGDSARYRTDLYSINIDGTGEERRTWTGNVSNPEWGPDGRFVAFEWNSNFQSKVYIHDLIESITTRIEDPDLGKVANPRWSRKYSNLMVFGEIWDSLDSIIRLYEVEPNSRTTVQTIKMNDEGVNYDWIETQ